MMSGMKFSFSMSYDAAPDAVYAMLSEPEFREQVCAAAGSKRHHAEIERTAGGMRVSVDQVLPSHGIPSFATKIVGDEIHILQKEEWTGPEGADLDVTIPGKPGHVRGTITLAPNGTGTVETVTGEVKVNVPLVGGKLEKLIEGVLESALRNEEKVGQTWLERR